MEIGIRFCLHGVPVKQNRNLFLASWDTCEAKLEFVLGFMVYSGIVIGVHLSLHGVAVYRNRGLFLTS